MRTRPASWPRRTAVALVAISSLLANRAGRLEAGERPAPAGVSGRVDYAGNIKPLLARHCVSCHGAEKPRGGLRLNTAAAARKGGKEGPAIVPGRAGESLADHRDDRGAEPSSP